MALPIHKYRLSFTPQFNPAEHLIHDVRRNGLYHVPCTLTLKEKAERIKNHSVAGSPMMDQQVWKLIGLIAR